MFDKTPVNVANEVDEIRLGFLVKQRERRGSIHELKQYLQGTYYCFKLYSFSDNFLVFNLQKCFNKILFSDYKTIISSLHSSPLFS